MPAPTCSPGAPIGVVARIMKIIPIERASMRRLPEVVDAVARRLRSGQTVVAFPEGTTWCGNGGGEPGQPHQGSGSFYPAMFQAAIDAARPVQPLRLSYHHVDGSVSTARAFVGDDTLLRSVHRLLTVRRTVARVHVESLQLPGTNRRASWPVAARRRCPRHGPPAPRTQVTDTPWWRGSVQERFARRCRRRRRSVENERQPIRARHSQAKRVVTIRGGLAMRG